MEYTFRGVGRASTRTDGEGMLVLANGHYTPSEDRWLQKLGEVKDYRESKGSYKGLKGYKPVLYSWLRYQRKARDMYPVQCTAALHPGRNEKLDQLFALDQL